MGGSLGKSSAPPAPDYAGLAAQQGAQSQQAAQYNTAANRVNQTGPNGSVTWSTREGADPNNPQAGDFTQTTSLSPEQQGLYDSSNRISQQFANTAENQLGRINNTMGQDFDTSGLPQLQGGQQGQFNAQPGVPNQSLTASSNPVGSVDPMTGQSQRAPNAGPIQGQVNAGNLPQLGGDYEGSRRAVEQAMMSRMQPQLDQNQSATENRLLNSGIERGTEAWNREMTNLNNQRNDAQMQAVLAGGQEQSRLHGMAASDRGQLYGEGVTSGNFANSAQNQGFTQGLASAGFNNDTTNQDFSRNLQSGTFANNAADSDFQRQAQAATFGNQAQGQQFAQQSGADAARNAWAAQQSQFGNQARQQGIQEQSYLRSLPLNEINALRSGAQVSSPQFSSYYTGGQAQPAPVFDAGVAAGNYATQAGAQRQSGNNALLGGLASLGSAWLGS
jgi:hypothetical protein